jgi:P450-derived glycosyltransferase activator
MHMSVRDLRQAITFGSRLYRQRADTAYAGHVRRDPMALLQLRPGRDNPYAIYDRIRARGTLVPTRLGNWVTPSHRVCNSVLRDRRFGVRPVDGDEPGEQDDFDLSFLGMNPPDHSRLRRLAQPAFSPAAVAAYRGRIEATVGDLLDRARAEAGGEFDLVSAFAAPLPIAVITDMLGIPDADASEFSRYGMVIGSALDGIKSLRHAGQLQASDAALRRLFESLFELRQREPSGDIVSRLVAASAAEGDQIRPGEMLPMCILLLVAGFETTVNLIGNGVLALLRHPEQWQALCADPEAMAPRAVDETLRFDPPVQRTGRVALEPLELEGKAIGKGQLVVTLIGAANRDPEAYDRPDTFDIRRDGAADSLAFSSGIHYCLGQPLARLEAAIALQVLAERMPGLGRAGAVRRRNATTIRGPIRLPVTAGSPRSRGARVPAGG